MSNANKAAKIICDTLQDNGHNGLECDRDLKSLDSVARAVVQALADAGLLLPGEPEVTVEYGVRNAAGEAHYGGWTRDDAEEIAAHRRNYDETWAVVQRAVNTFRTEWQEVADDD